MVTQNPGYAVHDSKNCESKHHILGGLPRFLCVPTESGHEVDCGSR